MDIILLNEECKKIIDYMSSVYDGFPYGACGLTSRLLAYVLQDRYNVSCLNIISALLKENPIQSHAWVWADGYIIDLTISQFNEKYKLNYPRIYISSNCSDYNKLFRYEGFNSLVNIYDGYKDEYILGYYKRYNYKFKEKQDIKVNYNGQYLGD